MSEAETNPAPTRLLADPGKVLEALPAMGRVMIASSGAGITHERIGIVSAVTQEEGYSIQRGDDHHSRIQLDAVAGMRVDRSGGMNGKVFPRIAFLGADGATICSVIGFEGLEPFDKALAQFAEEPEPASEAETPAAAKAEETDPEDAAARAFEAALQSGERVTFRINRPGFEQDWLGRVEAVKPAMGFVNVMTPDFHLHVKGGAVASWTRRGDALLALDGDGGETGLSILGLSRDV